MTNTTSELVLNNPLGGAIFYPLPSLASEKKCIRDTYRIRHPVFAIRIVFVTWCIRSSPIPYHTIPYHTIPYHTNDWEYSFTYLCFRIPPTSMSDSFIGSVVSIDCGNVLGIYQGLVSCVDKTAQTISITRVLHNCQPCSVPMVTIRYCRSRFNRSYRTDVETSC